MASWGVSQLLKCASLSYGLQNTIVLRGNERELPCVAVSCRRDYDNWFLLFRLFRLERGAIPYHKAGTHRRVLYEHLVAYKDRTEAEQRKSMDALVAQAQEYVGTRDALNETCKATDHVGATALIVDALDDAKDFYVTQFGFLETENNPSHLWLPLSTIRSLVKT